MAHRAASAATRLRPVLGALALGGGGGALFAAAGLPLAWMMGAMTLTTAGALVGLPLHMPAWLRAAMVAVLGVLLGSAFTPEMLSLMGRWSVSCSSVLAYVALTAGLTFLYLRRVARFDAVTAYFAAVPGGLNEMIAIGRASGGDERAISLAHASRILLVVLTIPFYFRLLEDYEPAGSSSAGISLAETPALDLLVLGLCAVGGLLAARALRLPAANLTGPLALSAAVHLAGITASQPAVEVVAFAQIVIGAGIGCRFAGTALGEVIRTLATAVGSVVIMLTVTTAFSFALGAVTLASPAALVLAFAPGGLAEMSLIALALDLDPAFVATHHVVRIGLVVMLVPLISRLIFRAARGGEKSAKGD